MHNLDAREIEAYHRDEFLVPDFKLSSGWLARLRTAVRNVERDHPEIGLDFVPSPHVPNYTPGLVDSGEWLAFAGIPEVLDIVGQLIGENIIMWGSALFGKPAGVGKATPWHQDGHYWPIRPLASCTVWIAIDDATTTNGCLRVVPGSQRNQALYEHRRDDRDDWSLNQVIDDPRVDLDAGVDVVLEAGQISIHDIYMVHGSAPNQSEARRAGLTYRYMPTTSVFDHAWAGEMHRTMGVTDMSERRLYLMRGIDVSGENDLTVGV